MIAVVVLAGAALATAAHLLPRRDISPVGGIALWLGALVLRSSLCLLAVVAVMRFVPASEAFATLTDWCLAELFPSVSETLDLSGHTFGDAAVVAPAVAVAVLVGSAACGVWLGLRRLRRWLQSSELGPGPGGSTLVGGAEALLAAVGLRRPRVVVSASALMVLDDGELAAGLGHEHAHIRRGHRYLTLLGTLLSSASRPLPGSGAAFGELIFHLERDADAEAARRGRDPAALASAICKLAGTAARPTGPGWTGLGGSDVAERAARLLAGDGGRMGAPMRRHLLAPVLATLCLCGAIAVLAATAELATAATAATHTSAPATCFDGR
jgi:Zn-dependent protease with chaperone function